MVSGWCWDGVLVGEGGEVLEGEDVGVLVERVVGLYGRVSTPGHNHSIK